MNKGKRVVSALSRGLLQIQSPPTVKIEPKATGGKNVVVEIRPITDVVAPVLPVLKPVLVARKKVQEPKPVFVKSFSVEDAGRIKWTLVPTRHYYLDYRCARHRIRREGLATKSIYCLLFKDLISRLKPLAGKGMDKPIPTILRATGFISWKNKKLDDFAQFEVAGLEKPLVLPFPFFRGSRGVFSEFKPL